MAGPLWVQDSQQAHQQNSPQADSPTYTFTFCHDGTSHGEKCYGALRMGPPLPTQAASTARYGNSGDFTGLAFAEVWCEAAHSLL